MEEPGTRPYESPGRETLGGEGSADLEKLLQTAEAENLQMVKLIDTERQKATALEKQIEDTVAQTEALEESTKRLDADAKQLHSKFKQNREICEGLRKTATVLDEHEEALRKKLEMVTLQKQTQNLEQGKVMEKYEKTWENYFKKYESMPLAKELSQIKQTAINSEMCVKEATEQISKIRSQIIEMEVEKTHMQEYLQENPHTATDSIIKIAKLFLDVEKSATTARQKVTELKNIHAQLSSATKKQAEPPKTRVEHQEAETTMTVDEKESENCQGDSEDTTHAEEIQDEQQQGVGRRISLTENQATYNRQQLDASSTPNMVTPTRANLTPRQIITFNQIPLIQHHQRTDMEDAAKGLPEESGPTAESDGRRNRVPEISTPLASSSQRQNEQRESVSNATSDSVTPQDVPRVSDPPTTPGSSTPANQSASGTPVHQSTAQSPLDFSRHLNFIRQVTKSPGEGFMYQGRSMYNTNQTQSPDQGGQPTNQRKEPEVIYEAPLNDQPDMALNFFQPFTQRTESANQNLFQTNPQPSPDRPRNMFMPASPAKSASSPRQSFSFGPSASSPGRNDSNFLPSNNGIFGRNNNPTDNDSFSSGFALFGSSDSPNTSTGDNSGGFSFSFGGSKSPSKPSGNSGFCLF